MARKWWTLTAVCTGSFMLLLDITIVNVALPDIERAFGASLADLQWVIDAYALTLAALLLAAGSVADTVGRRRVFAAGIVIFTAGSGLCGAAPDATLLSLARGVQGVGGAIMFANSIALLADAFAPHERGSAFGVFGAVTGVALAVGPVLGGAITSWLSWRWIFFVNLPIGALALILTLTRVRESRASATRALDWPGFVTFTAGLAALVFGLIRSNEDGWGSAIVAIALLAAVALLGLFALVEVRSRAPMLDLRLLRVGTFGGGLIAAWSLSASVFAIVTFLVLYLQGVLGTSPINTGLELLPLTGAIFATAGLAGRLTDCLDARWLIGPGFIVAGAGLLLMRGLAMGDHWEHFVPGLVVSGIGTGMINVPLASTAVGVVGASDAGMASGINATMRQVGIATAVAALGSVLAGRVRSSTARLLDATPHAAHAHAIARAVSDGRIAEAIHATPPAPRPIARRAGEAGFVDAINQLLLIAAVIAFLAGVLTLILIRQRDFVAGRAASPEGASLAAGAG